MRKRTQPTARPRSRRLLGVVGVVAVALASLTISSTPALAATGEQVYSSIPDPLPPNLPSLGGEAYSFGQLGDQVQFAASGGKLTEVEVTMSDWACEEGRWTGTGEEACTTTPGTGFELPITFNIYEVGEEDAVGPLLGHQDPDVLHSLPSLLDLRTRLRRTVMVRRSERNLQPRPGDEHQLRLRLAGTERCPKR